MFSRKQLCHNNTNSHQHRGPRIRCQCERKSAYRLIANHVAQTISWVKRRIVGVACVRRTSHRSMCIRPQFVTPNSARPSPDPSCTRQPQGARRPPLPNGQRRHRHRARLEVRKRWTPTFPPYTAHSEAINPNRMWVMGWGERQSNPNNK